MAGKKGATKETQLIIPDFIDIDAGTVSAAEAAMGQGGGGWALPEGTPQSGQTDNNGGRHFRWAEAATVEQAYRSVTKNGLLDIVLIVKSRAGQPHEGQREFLHLYMNMAILTGAERSEEVLKKHKKMTEDSVGCISTLLKATGLMPKSGQFKATLLNSLFPAKGQPGAKSPLDGKSVIVNVHHTIKPVKDQKTGEERYDARNQADSFSPDVADDE